MLCCWVVVVAALWASPVHSVTYRADGDFVIGAILPLTKPGCVDADPEGAALAEAIVHGVDQVKTESDFSDLRAKGSIGYDIRDNCGDADTTRDHAHAIAREALAYKKSKSGAKPADVVISAFTNADISAVTALDGEEILAAASYSAANARLVKTAANENKIGKLVSAYPEESKKILAVAEIAKEFDFKYVYGVADDNVEGRAAMATLDAKLSAAGICMEDLYGDVDAIVAEIGSNPLINVVVVHVDDATETALYTALGKANLTDLTIITTQGYNNDLSSLKGEEDVVDGGLDIFYNRKSTTFADYMQARTLPYTGRAWLQALFTGSGGNASCLTPGGSGAAICTAAKDAVRAGLVDNANDAEYAYHAVLGLAYAQMKASASGEGFLDVVKGLNVEVAALAMDPLVFNEELSATINKFVIKNLQIGAGGKLTNKYMGLWDETTMTGALNMMKGKISWSGGAKETPESVCSATCAPGSLRKFTDGECCWQCQRCPNGTVSDTSNAKECSTCPEGTVVRPDQSGCKKYSLRYFEWFGGPGAVVIVLMIIGVALVLFGLGVFSQNSHHELVLNANYNSLCLFLLAVLILIFAPVPLLVKVPTASACSVYIFLFNVGTSIALGILTSRSAWLNGFFDDNGELTKGTLGRYPRSTVVVAVTVLQVIIMIIAFNMESILTLHNLTDQWDVRYHECSTWASSTFWAGFVFNILVSVVGNSMSCSSIDMEKDAFELKYILLGHLMFYLWGICELVVFFRCNDEHLAGGQAIVCLLLAISLFFVYAWPKIYAILFNSKGGKLIPQEEEEEDEENVITEASAVSSKAGFTGQGIVSVKIREEDDE